MATATTINDYFLKVDQPMEFIDKFNVKTSTSRFNISLTPIDVQGKERVLEFFPVPSGFENCIVRRSIDLSSSKCSDSDWSFHIELVTHVNNGLKKEPSETCSVHLKLKDSIEQHKFVQVLVTVKCKCSKHPISSLGQPLDFVAAGNMLEMKSNVPTAVAKHKHDTLIDEYRYCPEFKIMITEFDISKATLVPLEIHKVMARKSCATDINHLYTKLLKPTDVTIKCRRGTEFSAHKDILAARSPVFKTMLSSELKGGIINIHDLSGDAVQVLLHFIYNGGLHEKWKSATEEVVYAADKYQLPHLKQFFDHLLFQVCNNGNALRLLQLAEKHSLSYAAQSISDFVDKNLEHVYCETVNLEPKRK